MRAGAKGGAFRVVTFCIPPHLMVMRLVSPTAHSQKFWETTFPRDEEIVSRVIAGELALFEVLMRRHNQRVYRTIRAILKDEVEVEDVMQQTYISAYSNLRQFAGAAKFSTWLTKIAINEALRRIRRKAHFLSGQDLVQLGNGTPMKLATDDANPEERVGSRELATMLEAAIDALADSYRSVVMLREIEGMSTAETAEVLGVTEEVVKTRLHRAKQEIRELLIERVNAKAGETFPFYAPRCDRVVERVLTRIEKIARS
jgi:RNA polymerase sigma-70 factor, ECF subfamily